MFTMLYPMLIFCFSREIPKQHGEETRMILAATTWLLSLPRISFFMKVIFSFSDPVNFPDPLARYALGSLFPHRPRASSRRLRRERNTFGSITHFYHLKSVFFRPRVRRDCGADGHDLDKYKSNANHEAAGVRKVSAPRVN